MFDDNVNFTEFQDSESVNYAYSPIVQPALYFIVLCSLVGLYGNTQIVWASFRERRLRHPCNILIAACAFSDLLHQLAHFVFFYLFQIKELFIEPVFCFWMLILPSFGLNFGAFIMLTIGVDRLLCVMTPMFYKYMPKLPYTLFMLMITTLYGIAVTYYCYNGAKIHKGKIICMIAEVLVSETKQTWHVITWFIFLLTVVCYVIIWIVIAAKKKNNKFCRLMKTLSVVLFSIVFSWFLTILIATIVLSFYQPTEDKIYFMHMNLGWTINFSIAANYFIYYYYSSEYRAAFSLQNFWLTCGLFGEDNRMMRYKSKCNFDNSSTLMSKTPLPLPENCSITLSVHTVR